MKKVVFFCLIIGSLFFTSCMTNAIYVPGEKTVKISNINQEYYNLAEEYFKLEKYEKAIEFYKLAGRDKSLRNVAYYKTGRCYALNKQYDKAEPIFRNMQKKDPENQSIKATLAYITAMNGNKKKASLLYKDLVLENPDNSDFLVNYISVLILAEDFETAKVNFEYLQEKFPDCEKISSLKESLNSLEEKESPKDDER